MRGGGCVLDIEANRQARKWSRSDLVRRAGWELIQPFFRFSPRPFWAWRNFLLRSFGAHLGGDVRIFPTVRITIPWNLEIGSHAAIGDRAILYALGPIMIGARATVSQNAHLCAGTHDFRSPTMDLLKRPIEIGEEAWICADAFIGPDVRVGRRAIVGARAVVTKDISENAVVAGNPAHQIGIREIPGGVLNLRA